MRRSLHKAERDTAGVFFPLFCACVCPFLHCCRRCWRVPRCTYGRVFLVLRGPCLLMLALSTIPRSTFVLSVPLLRLPSDQPAFVFAVFSDCGASVFASSLLREREG